MSIIKACLSGNSLRNTGKECDVAMGPSAMLIAVPASLVITLANLLNPLPWITTLMHAPKGQRVYPFFGNVAPINSLTNDQEGDTTITLDDGTKVFLRYGVYNRTMETIAGGLCYAKALQGLNRSGYRIIDIDGEGQMMLHKNKGGVTFGGMITSFMYSPSPKLADLKTNVYMNRFQLSYTPTELVQNGEVFAGGGELLSLMGLIDTDIVQKGVASTTIIKIGVETECAQSDLVALFGSPLAVAGNFKVTNKITGAVIVPVASIVSGVIHLTGTYVAGQTYIVTGAAASVWLAAGIEGYDAELGSVEILIP